MFTKRRTGAGSRPFHLGRPRTLQIEPLEPRLVLSTNLLITEFLASNDRALADEDGDFSDWVEIHNPSENAINLGDLYLADSADSWQFPSVDLDPGGYLLVFASGKNRAVVGNELHTNFRLNKDGERLALLESDGTTVIHEYAAYPPQQTDVSYGVEQQSTDNTLLTAGSTGRLLIPNAGDDAVIGSSWTGDLANEPFDDSSWRDVTVGVGFDGMDVDPGTELENVAIFKPTTQSSNGFGFSGVQGTDGDPNNFTHTATGDLTPFWEVDLEGNVLIDNIVLFNRISCCSERLYNITVEVFNDVDALVYTSAVLNPVPEGETPTSPGISLTLDLSDELVAVIGDRVRVSKTAVNGISSSEWLSLGEVEVYGIEVEGYSGLLEDDIEVEMKGINASAYLRLAFDISDPTTIDTLTLHMNYDDGFVAYVNGTEAARKNAPTGPLSFNATATATHDGLIVETIGLSPSLLQSGTNILALHGLNALAVDDDFLLVPELIARQVTSSQTGYLVAPTPGALNGASFAGFVSDTSFDVDRGFYDSPFDLHVTTATPGATIAYTTDGSVPTRANGTQVAAPDAFTSPIATVQVATTTILRAMAFKDDFVSTNVDTQTYLFLDDVLRQPAAPAGFPTVWDGRAQAPISADYQMDPDVVNNPAYSDEILDGLMSIPTMSLVTDPENLFGQERGIYTNSGQRGRTWEHPTSVEILETDGTYFQVDSGIRIHGYSWRFHSNTPKHSFRLEFRDEYGPTKLKYPLFPDAPVKQFDSIVLRAQGGRAWAGLQNPHEAQYLRDAFARDTARDMGATDGHAAFFHLYLNGLYWGLYHAVERPDAQMGEEYFGGSDQDYDALNRRTSTNEAIDGDLTRYNEMLALADQMLAEATAGQDTSATYAAIDAYLDVDDLIDFFLIHQYTTNRDGPEVFQSNNQRAIGSRVDDPNFRFFVWDMEYSMWNATDNINIDVDVPTSASHVYTALRTNADFRMRYADRAHKFLTHNGALTPAAAAARWQNRADEISTAIVAESARWGDAKRATPYTRDVEWQAERNRLMTQYFPIRTDVLLQQLTDANLYSTVVAPEFSVNGALQYGGSVNNGDNLSLFSSDTVHFTDTNLVVEGQSVRAHIPGDDRLGTTWTTIGFNPDADPSVWTDGTTGTGVGYEASTGYQSLIQTDVLSTMRNVSSSAFARIEFHHDDGTTYDRLQLQVKYDDGFVAYLNGVEIARSSNIVNDTPGVAQAGGHEAASSYEVFDVTAFEHLLRDGPGENVLAIHGINASPGSSDFLVLPKLVGGVVDTQSTTGTIYYTLDGETDPRLPGGALNPAPEVLQFSSESPITVTEGVTVRARAFEGAEWSALSEATFVVSPAADSTNLRISEINYNPHAANLVPGLGEQPVDNDQFEFIELMNVGSETIELVGVKLLGDDSDPEDRLNFTFAPTSLAPNERIVVVRNETAFESRYGGDARAAGTYSGKLPNSGDTLTVLTAENSVIQQFEYNDSGDWPGRADGKGSSLEVISLDGTYGSGDNWRSSNEFGGTPGTAGTGPVYDVIVNELLSHSDGSTPDQIELYNTTGYSVPIGKWYISDTSANLFRFQVADDTTIASGQYRVFNETEIGFAFDGQHGDDVWLVEADNTTGKPLRFADHWDFDATESNVSLGRWVNGDPLGAVFPMTAQTLGTANSGPVFGDLLLNEIHYNPAAVPPAEEGNISRDELEFIELVNTSGTTLDIGNWSLRGLNFTFPAETTVTTDEAIVVVTFDPIREPTKSIAFRNVYGIGSAPQLLGPASGQLNNAGERVKILKPEDPVTLLTGAVLVDAVRYDEKPPWPTEADGTGLSLTRSALTQFAPFATSWTAENPTPGSAAFTSTAPGDFDTDGDVDRDDLDAWQSGFGTPSGAMLSNGDADADGDVDGNDFLSWQRGFGSSAGTTVDISATPVAASSVVFDASEAGENVGPIATDQMGNTASPIIAGSRNNEAADALGGDGLRSTSQVALALSANKFETWSSRHRRPWHKSPGERLSKRAINPQEASNGTPMQDQVIESVRRDLPARFTKPTKRAAFRLHVSLSESREAAVQDRSLQQGRAVDAVMSQWDEPATTP